MGIFALVLVLGASSSLQFLWATTEPGTERQLLEADDGMCYPARRRALKGGSGGMPHRRRLEIGSSGRLLITGMV